MTALWLLVVAGAVIVILVVVSRRGADRKAAAIEDLERERTALEIPGIEDLVEEEAQDTGVAGVAGAAGVPTTVLLRVWHRDAAIREACAEAENLRFVLAEGIVASEATIDDVRLTCDESDAAFGPD